jgi:hypothetical protein
VVIVIGKEVDLVSGAGHRQAGRQRQ